MKAPEKLTAAGLMADLKALADPAQAVNLQRFFKTGPGEYGAGDVFLGLKVPVLRKATQAYRGLPLTEVRRLLRSRIHEHRLAGLMVLMDNYQRGDERAQAAIFDFYLCHTRHINNWDLVDLSAPNIVGVHLLARDRAVLDRLAGSPLLWERRIAILACFAFIRQRDYADAVRIAEQLLHDPHDLIHKAVGWMLREMGKRDGGQLLKFLDRHAATMPRTMLRYSIERLPAPRRQHYLGLRAKDRRKRSAPV